MILGSSIINESAFMECYKVKIHLSSALLYTECLLSINLPMCISARLKFTAAMEPFSSRRWRLVWPKQKAVVFVLNPKKLCNRCMAWFHSCWTDPVAHLLLKSSMPQLCFIVSSVSIINESENVKCYKVKIFTSAQPYCLQCVQNVFDLTTSGTREDI